MAHPTRTGDLVVFSYPPYQFDAATPGTLIARSAFFGQHGYVPDVQDLQVQHEHARDVPRRRRRHRARRASTTCAASTSRRPPRSCSASRRRSRARASCGATCSRTGERYTPLSIIGLNDFHGQLDPTTTRRSTASTSTVGGAAPAGDDVRRGGRAAARSRRCCSPPATTSARRRRTRRCWRTRRRSTWRTRGGSTRRASATTSSTSASSASCSTRRGRTSRSSRRTSSTRRPGEAPDWVKTSEVFRVNGVARRRDRRRPSRTTPELVSAGDTAGLAFLDEAERIRAGVRASCARMGVKVQIVVIHEGADARRQRDRRHAGRGLGRARSSTIVDKLQDTTIDLVIAGHTHRIANTVVGHIPVVEGVNAGGSYSVAQLMVKDGDVAWTGAATRVAKNLGVAQRADVKAIVDKANADTAVLRNKVIGTQDGRHPARPDAPERVGDGQPRRRRDARRSTRASRPRSPTPAACARTCSSSAADRRRAAGEITWGEVFAVLPFGNRTVIETLTGAQLDRRRCSTAFSPVCDPAIGTGRFPQVSGPEDQRTTATARRRSIDDSKAPNGRRHADAGRRRPTPSASSPTTSCSRVATATRRSRTGTDVPAARRRAARRGDRVHHAPTRRSPAWSRAA